MNGVAFAAASVPHTNAKRELTEYSNSIGHKEKASPDNLTLQLLQMLLARELLQICFSCPCNTPESLNQILCEKAYDGLPKM